MYFGAISSEDLRTFLAIPTELFSDVEVARGLLIEKKDQVLSGDVPFVAWCHWYELPAREHFAKVLGMFGGNKALQAVAQSENQIAASLSVIDEFDRQLVTDDEVLNDEAKEVVRKSVSMLFGIGLSVSNSFRSLLVFGRYLNDLVADVRQGGKGADSAMLMAIRIDPSVLGCQSVIPRLSRAVMEGDTKFLSKIKNAIDGKISKREQRNYQSIRLVLEILRETGAERLKPEELYQLFVAELNLLQGDSAGDVGDVANNLRQFAYRYFKHRSVSD